MLFSLLAYFEQLLFGVIIFTAAQTILRCCFLSWCRNINDFDDAPTEQNTIKFLDFIKVYHHVADYPFE